MEYYNSLEDGLVLNVYLEPASAGYLRFGHFSERLVIVSKFRKMENRIVSRKLRYEYGHGPAVINDLVQGVRN